jgi:hypothetical protein
MQKQLAFKPEAERCKRLFNDQQEDNFSINRVSAKQ